MVGMARETALASGSDQTGTLNDCSYKQTMSFPSDTACLPACIGTTVIAGLEGAGAAEATGVSTRRPENLRADGISLLGNTMSTPHRSKRPRSIAWINTCVVHCCIHAVYYELAYTSGGNTVF